MLSVYLPLHFENPEVIYQEIWGGDIQVDFNMIKSAIELQGGKIGKFIDQVYIREFVMLKYNNINLIIRRVNEQINKGEINEGDIIFWAGENKFVTIHKLPSGSKKTAFINNNGALLEVPVSLLWKWDYSEEIMEKNAFSIFDNTALLPKP